MLLICVILFLFAVHLPDFFQRYQKQEAAHTRADSRFRNRQIRRFHQYPKQTHDRTVGHEDNDGGQQGFGKVHTDRAGDQQDNQNYPVQFHKFQSNPSKRQQRRRLSQPFHMVIDIFVGEILNLRQKMG